jgi:hypothetical protein
MSLRTVSKLALMAAAVATAANFAVAQPYAPSKKAESKASAKSDVTKSMAFEAQKVEGYMDTPSMISIIDADGPDAEPITLNRSFKDALKENTDKETLERQVR